MSITWSRLLKTLVPLAPAFYILERYGNIAYSLTILVFLIADGTYKWRMR